MCRINILTYCSYYFPEKAAGIYLQNDIVQSFCKNGNTVKIYTPVPTRGISRATRNKYKNKKTDVQCEGKLTVFRYGLIGEGRNPVLRAIRYILQNIKQYDLGIKSENVDMIFAASTPPTQGVMCALVKKKLYKKQKRYIPFIYNLQDIFPDSLVNAGMTKNGSLLYKIGRKIEDYT